MLEQFTVRAADDLPPGVIVCSKVTPSRGLVQPSIASIGRSSASFRSHPRRLPSNGLSWEYSSTPGASYRCSCRSIWPGVCPTNGCRTRGPGGDRAIDPDVQLNCPEWRRSRNRSGRGAVDDRRIACNYYNRPSNCNFDNRSCVSIFSPSKPGPLARILRRVTMGGVTIPGRRTGRRHPAFPHEQPPPWRYIRCNHQRRIQVFANRRQFLKSGKAAVI